MKYSLLRAVVYVTILAVVSVALGCKGPEVVYQVYDVVSDPGAFSKPLTVEGVVYAYAKSDTSIVGVMDKKELQCKTPNCNKTLLAVKVTEPQLAIGNEIIVSGSIIKESWGYVLKADKVKVVSTHNLGG